MGGVSKVRALIFVQFYLEHIACAIVVLGLEKRNTITCLLPTVCRNTCSQVLSKASDRYSWALVSVSLGIQKAFEPPFYFQFDCAHTRTNIETQTVAN